MPGNGIDQNKKVVERFIIKIHQPDDSDMQFTVKPSTVLERVFAVYCEKKNISRGSIRFLFDGNRVNNTETVGTLEMEEGDSIDGVVMQTGGK